MPELDDELRRLSDQAAGEARPLAPDEVMRRGDRRRRRWVARGAVAVLAVAAAVAAGAGLSRSAGGGRTVPERPASHSWAPPGKPASPASQVPAPVTGAPRPVPTGSARLPTPGPEISLTPSPVPTKSP
jgi:hypothetical protein